MERTGHKRYRNAAQRGSLLNASVGAAPMQPLSPCTSHRRFGSMRAWAIPRRYR